MTERAIDTQRQASGGPVGWSDHSVNPAVLYRSIHRRGAAAVEFHLDLDGEGEDFATGCWLPESMQTVGDRRCQDDGTPDERIRDPLRSA